MSQTPSKNWLITGVSSGLGRTLAEAALAQGDKVVGTVRNAANKAEFEAVAPGRSLAVILDVTDIASVDAGIAQAASLFDSRIDVLVNNAGWGLLGAVEETSETEAKAVFDTNFFGQLNVLRAALPIMRAAGSGHVVAASAVGGFTGFAGLGVYSAAKAAVDIMNEALAQEVAPFGIKVTILTLGIFRTNFASSSLKHTGQTIAAYEDNPVGKFRGFMDQVAGKQPNDPQRGAAAILKLVASDNPPLHLALGEDAVAIMERKMASMKSDVDAWRDVSASVVFPKQ